VDCVFTIAQQIVEDSPVALEPLPAEVKAFLERPGIEGFDNHLPRESYAHLVGKLPYTQITKAREVKRIMIKMLHIIINPDEVGVGSRQRAVNPSIIVDDFRVGRAVRAAAYAARWIHGRLPGNLENWTDFPRDG